MNVLNSLAQPWVIVPSRVRDAPELGLAVGVGHAALTAPQRASRPPSSPTVRLYARRECTPTYTTGHLTLLACCASKAMSRPSAQSSRNVKRAPVDTPSPGLKADSKLQEREASTGGYTISGSFDYYRKSHIQNLAPLSSSPKHLPRRMI